MNLLTSPNSLRARHIALAASLFLGPLYAQAPIWDHSGDPGGNDWFGSAVAIMSDGDVDGDGVVGSVLAIGAPGYSSGSGAVELRVVHPSTGNTLVAKIIPIHPLPSSGDALGLTLRNVGNLAGPEFPIDDVAIHLPGGVGVNPSIKFVRPHPQTLRGQIAPGSNLYLGFYTEIEGSPGSRFGYAQDGGRDVNADGRTDVALGAPGENRAYVASGAHLDQDSTMTTSCSPFSACGNIYRIGGSPSPPLGMILTPLAGPAGSISFGEYVALIGDLDGDARAELVVGDPDWDGERGAVRVYSYDLGTAQWSLLMERFGSAPGARLGVVRRGQDLNGDGIDELLVAAPGTDAGAGVVECLDGGALLDGDPGNDRLWASFGSDFYTAGVSITAQGMLYGSALESMPDTNGDGVPEVLIGAPFEYEYGPEGQPFYEDLDLAGWPESEDSHERTGSVTMLSGDSGNVLDRWFGPDLMDPDDTLCPRSSMFGSTIASGDLDNDGDVDFLVGAPKDTINGCNYMGSAYGYEAELRHGWPLVDWSNPNQAGFIRGYGSTSLSENALTLRVTQVPPHKYGMFWISTDYLPQSHSSGLMMSGTIMRINSVKNTGQDGEASHLLDLGTLTELAMAAGIRVYTQYIYRDDVGSFDWTGITSLGFQP